MRRSRKASDTSIGDDVAGRVRIAMTVSGDERPIYVRIAMSLADEMTSGRIPSGERLPSQRRFAKSLGVNLTTMTRAMGFLKDRGLILPEVGRGTAVRGRALDHVAPSYDLPQTTPAIDLSVLKLHSTRYDAFVGDALGELARSGRVASGLREYHPALGDADTREAGSRWLADWDVPASPDRIAVTAGAQQALVVALASVSRPGDVVLAPKLVYQGLKGAARLLGLGLLPVDIDEHGILPESVEEQASRSRARALFVVPTVDNPTGSTLPLGRRREIAALARRFSLAIIEDDIFRPLGLAPIPSFAALHPEGTFHIASLSKVIAPGCRCGFLAYPPAFHAAVSASQRGSIWMVDQLSLALMRELVERGLHRAIVAELRDELIRRHESAIRVLGPALAGSEPWSNTVWIKPKPGWRSADIVEQLRQDGVGATAADTFAVERDEDEGGFRIYKSSAASPAEWQQALAIIGRRLDAPPAARPE